MKKDSYASPSEPELEQIEVTPEDEQEYLAGLNKVRHALQRARIPGTLDWATVLLSTAARVLHVRGMPRASFQHCCRTFYAYNLTVAVAVIGLLPPVPTAAQLGPMRNRLVGALLKAKIDLHASDTPMHMLSVGGCVFADYGVTMDQFLLFADAMYQEAEVALTHLARSRSNQA